jgi:Flp pilus assembly protein TadB
MIEELLVTGSEGGAAAESAFVREFQRQMEEVGERLNRIEEDLRGDEHGWRPGLWGELREIKDKQREHQRLLDAWQRDQEVQAAMEQRRKRFTQIVVGALSLIATVLSILVGVDALTGFSGIGP